jgi:hypothetical protein
MTTPSRNEPIFWRAAVIRGLIGDIDVGAVVPADVIREHARIGDLADWLSVGYQPPGVSLDFMRDAEKSDFARTMAEHANFDTGGTFGVANNGLALIVAWLAHDIDHLARGLPSFT